MIAKFYYAEGEEESKIHEIENQCKAKFLYKPFIPLPNLSEYLGCIIKVRTCDCQSTMALGRH